jgi:hypothetical protein
MNRVRSTAELAANPYDESSRFHLISRLAAKHQA